jgi:hypothetical protein
VLGVGTVVCIVLIKPVAPINSPLWNITSKVNSDVVEMVGWQDLTAQVAGIYANLPEDQKLHSAILTGNYGEAGALELYGSAYGLPLVISGGNSMWARGYGDPPPETVIVVGYESQEATSLFKECEMAGQVTNKYGVMNEESSSHNILFVCRQPREPWSVMWKNMQWFQ